MFGPFAALLFVATTVFQAQAALPANCSRNATVALGDTCNSISAKYSVSTYQLATVNAGIIDALCDNLYPGEVICLGIVGRDCTATHVVQSGDTCLAIANAYGIPESTLIMNIPLNEICTNLHPGEVLCVSSTIYV